MNPRFRHFAHPEPAAASRRSAARCYPRLGRAVTIAAACLASAALLGGVAEREAQAAVSPGRLPAAMRPNYTGKSRSIEVSADGAALVKLDGELGVRAWASQPGSCMGPAGPAAAKAARAAAEALIDAAAIKRSSNLEVEGVMEVDLRTRRGVECSVEITVTQLERRRGATTQPRAGFKRSRAVAPGSQ